jgi:hypothetical protein
MDESTEQPAVPMEVSGMHTLLETEREARSSHNVRKKKEHPTTEENTHIRARLKLSTPAATTVQAHSGMNTLCTHVNQILPVTDSARIHHLVPDTEEMATSSEKVPAKTSLTTISRGIKGDNGNNESQSLQLKQ